MKLSQLILLISLLMCQLSFGGKISFTFYNANENQDSFRLELIDNVNLESQKVEINKKNITNGASFCLDIDFKRLGDYVLVVHRIGKDLNAQESLDLTNRFYKDINNKNLIPEVGGVVSAFLSSPGLDVGIVEIPRHIGMAYKTFNSKDEKYNTSDEIIEQVTYYLENKGANFSNDNGIINVELRTDPDGKFVIDSMKDRIIVRQIHFDTGGRVMEGRVPSPDWMMQESSAFN